MVHVRAHPTNAHTTQTILLCAVSYTIFCLYTQKEQRQHKHTIHTTYTRTNQIPSLHPGSWPAITFTDTHKDTILLASPNGFAEAVKCFPLHKYMLNLVESVTSSWHNRRWNLLSSRVHHTYTRIHSPYGTHMLHTPARAGAVSKQSLRRAEQRARVRVYLLISRSYRIEMSISHTRTCAPRVATANEDISCKRRCAGMCTHRHI